MLATFEALLVFLIFFPGFLSERIVRALSPKTEKSSFEIVVDAAALSVVVYGTYVLLALVTALPVTPVVLRKPYLPPFTGAVSVDVRSVAVILGLSLLIGGFLGKVVQSGTLYRFLRAEFVSRPRDGDKSIRARIRRGLHKALGRGTRLNAWLRMTQQTGRNTVWEDVFGINPTPLVAVTLGDGSKVVGVCKHYSTAPSNQEVLIAPHRPGEETAWPIGKILFISPSGKYEWRTLAGIYIGKEAKVKAIEFHGEAHVEW